MFTYNLYTNVHRSFIYNSQKQKSIQYPSTGEWLNCGVYTQWNIPTNKKEWTTASYSNLVDSSGNYVEQKQTSPKWYILYDSIYEIILKWQNFRNTNKINGCQGLGTGEGRCKRKVDVVRKRTLVVLKFSWLWWSLHESIQVIKL